MLRVLFIALVLFIRISRGLVAGAIAGKRRMRYPGSCPTPLAYAAVAALPLVNQYWSILLSIPDDRYI